MEILEKTIDGNILKIEVSSNEESLFFLLKVYFEKLSNVDIVGVYKSHHLIDKTEFHLKVKKGDPLEVFKKTLMEVKKELKNMRLK